MRILLCAAIVAAAGIVTPAFADCSNVGTNTIADATVDSLEQQAANAEEQASLARSDEERRRWEDTAQSLQMRAQAMRDQNATMAQNAQQECQALENATQ